MVMMTLANWRINGGDFLVMSSSFLIASLLASDMLM